jgi:O-antigen ligase
MSGAAAGARGAPAGAAILLLLGVAPLLAGAVHPPVYATLLALATLLGLHAAWRSPSPLGPLPAGRLLLAAHALVLLQLVPLPPAVLGLVSPGSLVFWTTRELAPFAARPISVSPADTLRGLAFLVAFSLLALAVWRELTAPPWARRLLLTVVGTGLVATVGAFVQSVSSQPARLWGVFQPDWDWAVFGPYVNRNHFGGYLVMAAPLAIGFALEALSRLGAAWRRRHRGVLALGDAEGGAALAWCAVAMLLVAGLLASGSRGAIAAFFATALVLPLAAAHRRRTALGVVLLAGLGLAWIGLDRFLAGFASRGVRGSRLELWEDMLSIVPQFPLLGVGWNAFATAYPWYQTVWKTLWVGQAHNDYLQVLLDGGSLGAGLLVAVLAIVLRRAVARARRGPVDLGLFGAVLGLALHNVVDFNWQIPANAATWVALATLACRPAPADG